MLKWTQDQSIGAEKLPGSPPAPGCSRACQRPSRLSSWKTRSLARQPGINFKLLLSCCFGFGSINISEVLLRCKLLTLLAKSTSHNDTLEHHGHVLKSRMVIVALESQWLVANK